MRFMLIAKATESSERGLPPSPELMAAMGKLMEETAKSGKMLDGGGLMPSKFGAKLSLSGGKVTVTDGPYAEAKELIGGFIIVQVDSKEEAIEMTRHFLDMHAQILGPSYEMESEIRQMYEPPPAA